MKGRPGAHRTALLFALGGAAFMSLGGVPSTALAAAPGSPRVSIETRVTSGHPYVQAATRVTVRILSARALYHADLELQGTADVLVHQVGADDRSTVRRGGRSYDVLTRQYLLFGQRSGQLRLPGPILSAEVLTRAGRSNRYYNPGGQVYSPYGYGAMISVVPFLLRGKDIVLDVRPRPAAAVGSYWLPARQVTLTRQWNQSAARLHVGDALALDLTVQADGLTAEQLPDLAALLAVPPGLRAYPDEPKLDDFSQGDSLIGRREQGIALIPSGPGKFTVPALELRWWDTAHDVERTVAVPAKTIVVLPSVGAAISTAAGAAPAAPAAGGPQPSSGFVARDPWTWVALALALAWVATLGAWYASRLRGRPHRASAESPVTESPGASRSRAAFI
ncbi:MAG: BatD family protein, partial [Steroidobacteraceae bacterium]